MKKIFIASSAIVLGIFLFWHLRLGLTRYFDVDEFAYLHWAYNVFSGKLPYRDFLFYVPPGFLWFLAPLFRFFQGTDPIIAGRVLAFVIFGALGVVTALLFWEVRRSWVAIVVPLVLAFLPLPSDKFLEIRPDTLAILLAMLGLLFQVRKNTFVSGFFYGLSLLVLPKTLPQVVMGLAVGVVAGNFFQLLLGVALPWIVFAAWAATLPDPSLVWYSIFRLPQEVGKISQIFPMQPDLFFYPNATYYGENGWSVGLFVNHLIWLIGLGMGALRLLVPKNKIEFLIAASVFSHVMFFFWIYPLRHAQYLIPIAVFVAWYAADFINFLWYKCSKKFPTGIIMILLVGGYAGLLWVFLLVNGPKVAWDNKESLATIAKIHATIPTSEYLLDLDGRTLYYQDPYYVCCLPWGEFAPYLSRKLPSLAQALARTKTKYIYQGELQRVNTLLPEDQDYIRRNFQPLDGDGQLLTGPIDGEGGALYHAVQ